MSFPLADIPSEFVQTMGTAHGRRVVLVGKFAEDNTFVAMSIIDFDGDTIGQIAADTCDAHLTFLCAECFNMADATTTEGDPS